MTYNSSTMHYASYTILLGRLQTCCVGSEKDDGESVCPLCQPQSTAVSLFSEALDKMGQLSARYFPERQQSNESLIIIITSHSHIAFDTCFHVAVIINTFIWKTPLTCCTNLRQTSS